MDTEHMSRLKELEEINKKMLEVKTKVGMTNLQMIIWLVTRLKFIKNTGKIDFCIKEEGDVKKLGLIIEYVKLARSKDAPKLIV